MDKSICSFMPDKENNHNIRTLRFVYETEFKALSQPFFLKTYSVHLITEGRGILKINSLRFSLERGTLFFCFPGCTYEIEASDDFRYIYIDFIGADIVKMLENRSITVGNPICGNFSYLIDFWKTSIKRVTIHNAHFVTESVLLNTISYISTKEEEAGKSNADALVEALTEYIDIHYKDADITVQKIAERFSYSAKYVSSVFKKKMNISLNKYINQLRIQYAIRLLENNVTPVSYISTLCGFSDPLYFSKVFRRKMGMSPSAYLKNIKK
ncbi:MAG: helix-turn-helix domain-containing protein [Ruminococcaceae bacterium]|nr:helix-turn-helix domain-containing protein [Oscillospiraceae bacterium]